MQKVTLKDIAAITGYTINTVSRALKDKPDISEETKKKICAAADQMGYIRNSAAGSLRTGQTLSVGVIAANVSNPFFSIIIREIEQKAYGCGYNVIVFNTYGDAEIEKKRVRDALSKNVDGIIISPHETECPSLTYLKQVGIPFVVIGRTNEDSDINFVTVDDEKGGYLAVKHLLTYGHRQILHLSGPENVPSTKYRLDGYKRALEEFNIPFNPQYVIPVGLECGSCRNVIHQLITNGPPFDAIFAFNDTIAAEAVYAAYECKIEIPKELSIVGFDNIERDILISIPLDSIGTASESVGETCIDVLMDNIQNRENWNIHQKTLDVELIKRGSVQ